MQYFIHFSQNANLLIDLSVDAAALIGVIFILRALLKLKIYGEMRSMMAPNARISQVLLLLFTGVLLVYFPYATKEMLRDALLGAGGIKEMPYHNTSAFNGDIKHAVERIMSLLGHIALIRGIVQLGAYQEGGRHSLGKSVTHIVAGVCAINIQQTSILLSSLVGLELGVFS